MDGFPQTRPSLLVRLRDRKDSLAWGEFSELYSPLVYRFARRKGFQDADAADLLQETFRKLAVELPKFSYDPRRGAFRSWLFTILRQQMAEFLKRRFHQQTQQATWTAEVAASGELLVSSDDEQNWNRDWQQQALEWSMRRIKDEFGPATWAAFVGTALEGRPVDEISRQLGMSAGAIYVAKSRVISRLKEQIRQFEDDEASDLPDPFGTDRS